MTNEIYQRFLLAVLCVAVNVTAQAQLAVTVSPPKIVGQKAVVPLAMKNGFAERIESARAVVFLLDEKGKMIGQGTRWVIGGSQDKTDSRRERRMLFILSSRATNHSRLRT